MSTGRFDTTSVRREVLVSLLLIGVASVGFGTMTWSYFADSDASQDNAIQAGTLDVRLDGADSLSATFSIANGSPTDAASHNYTITNEGTIDADHLEISIAFAENDSLSEPSDADLNVELNDSETASLINVTRLEYQNHGGGVIEDVLASVSDGNGNGVVDLEDVQSQQSTLDGLAPPKPEAGNNTYLVIAVEIASDDDAAFTTGGNTAGALTGEDEDVMADGVDVTLTFTLNQAASQ